MWLQHSICSQKVYWSDVKERAIYVCDLDGSNQEVLLRRNESLGLVEGNHYCMQKLQIYIYISR